MKEFDRMATDSKPQMVVHNVYFTLKDGSPENIQKLIDACFRYLKDHPGVVYFGAGPLVAELERPVNVRDFHVGLHVVFKSKQDHDIYQTAPLHLKFIEENKPTWDKVRVFDTYTDWPDRDLATIAVGGIVKKKIEFDLPSAEWIPDQVESLPSEMLSVLRKILTNRLGQDVPTAEVRDAGLRGLMSPIDE